MNIPTAYNRIYKLAKSSDRIKAIYPLTSIIRKKQAVIAESWRLETSGYRIG